MMVWGLELPYEFGTFFPDGDFVGYRDQLDAAFDAMSAEEQAYYGNLKPAYRFHVSQCFTFEHGTMHGEQLVFRPVAEHEWPGEFQMRRRYKSLGALIKTVNALLLVEKRFKDILERLEPGVHQFSPVKLTLPNDEVYPAEYFTIVIGTFLTSFDSRQSDEGAFTRLASYHSKHFDAETSSKLAFSKSVLDRHHLWRERELKTPHLFLSDTLRSEVIKAGLTLPTHFQMMEV